MGSTPLTFWTARSTFRLDRQDPYLNLHFVMIYVRDQEQSLQFYLKQLGFSLVVDHRFEPGDRWIEVAPPDGTANLALVLAKPGSEEYNLIGRFTQVIFLTEDVDAKYRDWCKRGVRFLSPPQKPEWGGVFAQFEDVDGNSFGLAGFDDATREVEARRRALAEKLESEQLAAQELEIAKQVQARLLPQNLPVCRTLDYAGICLQARQVGGDYYDFLDLGEKRLGIVIGDISGKGIAGALLMANLQANLRSQCAVPLDELLRSANRLFYHNTADSAYATLFFGEYYQDTQRLRYANCGHLPALVLRSDGSLERLESTSTVLGLFKDWDCVTGECQLFREDTVAIYTDGVTESFNDQGEEYGEERLAESLRRNGELSSTDLLQSIVQDVREFSSDEQLDDVTLIVAKCTAS